MFRTLAFLILMTILAIPAQAKQANRIPRPTDARECMVLALYHEARGESEQSIIKHAWTIVWRVKRDDFPDNVCAVVFQRGKFSAFNRGIRPMRKKADAARVARIADLVLKKAFPDVYGGSECLEQDDYTDRCVQTVADTIPTPVGVITHYAVADCKFLRKPGYRYVRTKSGRCVPRWALKMTQVASEPCAKVRRRSCDVVFWKSD
jgi:hypothetical protein